MSKTILKKELSALSREQLIETILTAYSSSKSIKEYFDFFAVPDVDKLYDKHQRDILKEIGRGKYHQSTARISRIRKYIKDFESFNPGVEKIRDLRLFTVEALIKQESVKNFSDTLINGALKLLNDTIKYADSHLIFDSTIQAVEQLLKDTSDRSRHFRNFLRHNIILPESRL